MAGKMRSKDEARVDEHGGALDRAAARFGSGDWLDLSTGINPWPWPVPMLSVAAWRRLPDEAALADLKAAARAAYGAPDDAPLAMAPGSQALIQCLPRQLPPGRVHIEMPTYAEHARCWTRAGHDLVMDEASADYVVICNPNNPDGRRQGPAVLTDLARRLAARDGLLVVDEAFADTDPVLSVAPWAGMAGLCVLRSFGKFFGLAGLRLGAALAPAGLAWRIEQDLGPWAVPGPAIEIGTAAYRDATWIAGTRRHLAAAAHALDRLLEGRGLTVLGGTDLFRLVQTPRAADIAQHLGRRHILVRGFTDPADWLRFGLPPDAAAAVRLDAALAEAMDRG